MKKTSLPEYQELANELAQTTLQLQASQVHGLICGILCKSSNSQAAWEAMISGTKTKTIHALLQKLYDASHQQLKDFMFEFQLLLPSEDKDLADRAEALTIWCQGFLTGLKSVEIPIEDRSEGEMTEAINDLIEIAKMNYEEVVNSDEDEAAFIELVEYVRMAVILIYEEQLAETPVIH